MNVRKSEETGGNAFRLLSIDGEARGLARGHPVSRRSPGKRGPISVEELALRIDHALRHIDDRIELNRNPLVRLPFIQDLAHARYSDCVHPCAVALRHVVRRAVDETLADLQEEERGMRRLRQFLHLYASGSSVKAASKQLGLSREHCSRVLKKQVVLFVAEKFSRLVRSKSVALAD
jgi:hypothetical protein